ncbi:hypothetical protein GOP47_0001799 [Adiantum capillus-veneris]|uniref:Serine hydrolase domain-containing protein n=1 Tax=Adiantum capillus-veneris TaxID=13818 RepID=A0A9D4VA96_ADICA|nr:hypothetical protein GOP47_0001799 [Adiantum capillus-veneris]
MAPTKEHHKLGEGGASDVINGEIKRLKVLCLHGFRTSGLILQRQFSKLGPSVLELLDMIYLDGPRPCGGPSMVEGYFPPPYYEWYLPNRDYTELVGLDSCLDFLCKYIEEHGPFDGFMGFSQGACICAALVAMQQKGLALTCHPLIKFVVIVAGGMFEEPNLKNRTYPAIVTCPSIHIIGAKDERNFRNEALAKVFENPIIIRHEGNHTVPRLGHSIGCSKAQGADARSRNFAEALQAFNDLHAQLQASRMLNKMRQTRCMPLKPLRQYGGSHVQYIAA